MALAAPVRGEVRERGTGDPIEGAFVRTPGGGEVITGAGGAFSVALPDGAHWLVVGSFAHEPIEVSVVAPAAEVVQIYLRPAPPPAEIVVEARRESPHVSRQVLDRERVEKTPGTHDDPFRLIQALPGVAATPEYAPNSGDLVFRGAAPAESRIYLDGVEIPYLYHFQQYASVLHTRLLDEVAVYPSTFGPEYGDTVGGVVDARSRPADAERWHGGGNANFIMVGGYLQAPAGPQSVSASGRRSYLDLVESENDQYTLWPAFWDYLGRYDRKIGDDHTLSLTAFGAGDSYGRYAGDSALLDPLEQDVNPEFVFDRSFHAVSARLEDSLPSAGLETALAYVADTWEGTLPDAHQRRGESYVWLRHAALLWPGAPFQLSLGAMGKGVWLDRDARTDRAWSEFEREAPLLARGVSVDERLQQWRGGAWVEPRIAVGGLTVQPGLRVDASSASGGLGLDPRASVFWSLPAEVQLRLAAGRYSQAPPLDALSPVSGDPTLGRTVSDQAALGVEWAVAGRWEVGVEGWGKAVDDAVVEAPGEAPVAVNGAAYGVELTSRYRLRERFFSWVSLTMGRAIRGGAPFDYDQPFAVNAVASWDFLSEWNAGVRYRIASGLPYTPIDDGLYDGTTDTYLPVEGAENSARLPNYQKLDVHLERTLRFRRWKAVPYLEAWWVPPTGNVLYPAWSYDYSQEAYVEGPSFLPLLGVRVEI